MVLLRLSNFNPMHWTTIIHLTMTGVGLLLVILAMTVLLIRNFFVEQKQDTTNDENE